MKLLALAIFTACAACANTPGQPSAVQDQANAKYKNTNVSEASADVHAEPATCGRQSYPVYQDVENQKIVTSEIESGSAAVILHFHNLGQATIDAFLARNEGVLAVESQWPDWGAISITVNEAGLRQLSQDCAIRVIEANKREYPQ